MPRAWSIYARGCGEPGHEGALKVEMKAALAGGVTSVICPPDTDPPLDEPGLVRMLRQRSRESAGARTYPLGALTAGLKGEALAAIKTLVRSGMHRVHADPQPAARQLGAAAGNALRENLRAADLVAPG